MDHDDQFAEHDAKVRIVTDAVASLWPQFGPRGMPPECIFEGAIRGVGAILLSLGAKPAEIADLLDDMATGFRDLAPPKLRVVHSRDREA
jgi:hypothetical protein